MSITTTKSDSLNLFDKSRINQELLNTPSFLKALRLVETTIANPKLSIKFSQTCIASLRNEQLYDIIESSRHVPAIYSHLLIVLRNINIKLADINDRWSSFTLGHKTKSSLDTITFDRASIYGAARIRDDDVDGITRLVYFFYAKLLHELAHASLAELDRKLPDGDYEARFSSPATHAMTGDTGDAIERHFFGSVTDARGRYINEEKSIYYIEHVILRERRNKQIITNTYLREFLHLNFVTIESIPWADTSSLPESLTPPTKRKKTRSPSPSLKHRAKELSPTKGVLVGRMSTTHRWGWGPEANDDCDDNDEEAKLLLDADGNPRPRCVCWKA